MKHPTRLLFALAAIFTLLWVARGESQEPVARVAVAEHSRAIINIGEQVQGPDLTDALQHAINTQHQHQLPIYIPAGEWECRGITIPKRSGHHIIWGGHASVVSDSRMVGKGCIVRHTGDPDTPLITDHGSHLTMEGGATFIGHGKGKGIGYLQTKHSAGIGTGKTLWTNRYQWNGFRHAIQIGSTIGEHNCETNQFGTMGFSDCEYGVMLVNTQGMGHHFDYMGGNNNCDWLVGVQGGGVLTVDTVMLINGLIKFVPVEGRGRAGRANAIYTFQDIKIDAGQSQSVLRIDNSSGARAAIIINRGINSNATDRYTMAKLTSACALTIRDFRGWGGFECQTDGYGKPNIVLERCGMWEKEDRIEGDCHFVKRDCFYYFDGSPLGVDN